MPVYPQLLTIVNPSAETGGTSGWTDIVGALRAVQNVTYPGGVLKPLSGNFFFGAGVTSTSEAYQDIPLPADAWSDIDEGGLIARFVGHQGGTLKNDKGWLGITCLSSSKVALAPRVTTTPSAGLAASWWRRELEVSLPTGTRILRLSLFGSRTSGSNLDVYWDDFAASILRNPYPVLTVPTILAPTENMPIIGRIVQISWSLSNEA